MRHLISVTLKNDKTRQDTTLTAPFATEQEAEAELRRVERFRAGGHDELAIYWQLVDGSRWIFNPADITEIWLHAAVSAEV